MPGHTCLGHPSSDLHSSGPAGTTIPSGAVITAFSFEVRLVMPPICVLRTYAVHPCHTALSVCLSPPLSGQLPVFHNTKQLLFRRQRTASPSPDTSPTPGTLGNLVYTQNGPAQTPEAGRRGGVEGIPQATLTRPRPSPGPLARWQVTDPKSTPGKPEQGRPN